jgi:drug/metabolite transporter (DMT)-like permease
VLTFVILAASGEPAPAQESFAWAAFAGASGFAGIGFFYMALARGTMGIVAPLAAVIGAGLPVLLAIIGGEDLSRSRLAGIGLALVAVVLISLPARPRTTDERRNLRIDLSELPLVVLAGLGFAGFFVGIDRASSDGALWWPLVIVRVVGLATVLAVLVVLVVRSAGDHLGARLSAVLGLDRLRAGGRSMSAALPVFVLTGAGDMGGNAFFVLSRGADEFSVAVVLSSLYPVVTAILAAIFLRERLRWFQIAGVALAATSVPLLR